MKMRAAQSAPASSLQTLPIPLVYAGGTAALVTGVQAKNIDMLDEQSEPHYGGLSRSETCLRSGQSQVQRGRDVTQSKNH